MKDMTPEGKEKKMKSIMANRKRVETRKKDGSHRQLMKTYNGKNREKQQRDYNNRRNKNREKEQQRIRDIRARAKAEKLAESAAHR
jgi:outer membrane PBP1 activator LpoA protein